MTNEIDIETFKLCLQQEDRSEKSFKFFASITIVVIILLEIAESQSTIIIEFLGSFPSEIINGKAIFIRIFFSLLMLFSLCEWTVSVIDKNRHPLYKNYSQRKSSAAKLANWWDSKIKCSARKAVNVLDFIQNMVFLLEFVLIILMLIL